MVENILYYKQYLMFPKLFLDLREQNVGLDRYCYENSESYLLQATRNGPSILYAEENSAVIYTTKGNNLCSAEHVTYINSNVTSPSSSIYVPMKDAQYIIIAGVGPKKAELITKIAKRISCVSKKDVIVKNVGTDLEHILKENGFKEYEENETWGDFSKYDDNTYPQQVIAVEDCFNLNGSKYRGLRGELRRFEKQNPNIRFNSKHIGLTTPNDSESSFYSLLDRWSTQMAEKSTLSKNHFYEAYELFVGHKSAVVAYSGQNMVGFMTLENTYPWYTLGRGNNCVSALITDFNYKHLYRAMIFEAVKRSCDIGYSHLNIGGSGTLSQHKSKRVFQAEIEIHKKHLVWGAR